MGMFSEIHAQVEAEKLEKILFKVRKPLWIWAYPFVALFVYPLYDDACSEAWTEVNPKLEKFYRLWRIFKRSK